MNMENSPNSRTFTNELAHERLHGEIEALRHEATGVSRINTPGWRSTTSLADGISHACKDYVLQSAE